jgi:hypothetical protein
MAATSRAATTEVRDIRRGIPTFRNEIRIGISKRVTPVGSTAMCLVEITGRDGQLSSVLLGTGGIVILRSALQEALEALEAHEAGEP